MILYIFVIILIIISILVYQYAIPKCNICEGYHPTVKHHINNIRKIKEDNGVDMLPLKIPRQIIQSVRDKNKIHPQFIKNIKYVKKTNPTWKYYIYDNKDMDKYMEEHTSKEIFDAYMKINPLYGAARVDLFRYNIIYNEGGVYMDIKSATKYPLDDILYPDDEFILSNWDELFGMHPNDSIKKYGEFQQWYIISKPKHPILKIVIDNVVKKINNYTISDGIGKSSVLKITGPIVYTESIIPHLSKYKFRIEKSQEDVGMIYNNTSYIYFIHTHVFGKNSKNHYSFQNEPLVFTNEINDVKSHKVCSADPKNIKLCSTVLNILENINSVLQFSKEISSMHPIINYHMKYPNKHTIVCPKDNPNFIGKYEVVQKVPDRYFDCIISDNILFFKKHYHLLNNVKVFIIQMNNDVNEKELEKMMYKNNMIKSNITGNYGNFIYVYVRI